MNPTVQIVTANKHIIDELRSLDTHNRKLKRNHVEYIRSELRAGRWTLTSQGIGVSVSNFIVDGGHRLEAMYLEGYPPVQFLLVRGLPDEAQKYVDQHSPRSKSDTLSLFFDLNLGSLVVACMNVIHKNQISWQSTKPSPDDLIEKFVKFEKSINAILSVEKASRLPAPVVAALVIVHQMSQSDSVMTFTNQVVRGEMLKAGDPALALRNFLSSHSGAYGGGNVQRERFMKTYTAVRAFLEGRPITKLYAKAID